MITFCNGMRKVTFNVDKIAEAFEKYWGRSYLNAQIALVFSLSTRASELLPSFSDGNHAHTQNPIPTAVELKVHFRKVQNIFN